MHTISSKDVDSIEHWKNSLQVADYNPKNEEDAQDKAAQLKKDGLKDISITQHTLNFKEENNEII